MENRVFPRSRKTSKRLSKFRGPLGKLRFDSPRVKNDAAIGASESRCSRRISRRSCLGTHTWHDASAVSMCEMRFSLISPILEFATKCMCANRDVCAMTSLCPAALFLSHCAHLCQTWRNSLSHISFFMHLAKSRWWESLYFKHICACLSSLVITIYCLIFLFYFIYFLLFYFFLIYLINFFILDFYLLFFIKLFSFYFLSYYLLCSLLFYIYFFHLLFILLFIIKLFIFTFFIY